MRGMSKGEDQVSETPYITTRHTLPLLTVQEQLQFTKRRINNQPTTSTALGPCAYNK
jgi:hypothetical protein